MSLETLLKERSLLVCVGPGGVGKTTVAAALGLQAARMGRRTLVLTIDPARRLAAMLGLDGLDDSARPVPLAEISPRGAPATAPLLAAMLESEASYDALIHRIAGDPDHRAAILGNRLYQLMRRSFGASHAYVAMERLHDALHSGRHDLVVLDTPPTRSALDILDAPSRLAAFLDEDVVRWFVRTPADSLRGRLFSRSGAAATRLLGALVGDALVRDLGEFFSVFLGLREGFQARAESVQRALRAPDAGFVLVSSAAPQNLADAQYLHEGLAARAVSVQAAVFNRAYTALERDPRALVTATDPTRARRLGEDLWPPGDPRRPETRALLERVDDLRVELAAGNRAAQQAIARFARLLPGTCACVQAPSFSRELRDLPSLAALGDLLCDGPGLADE